MKEGVVKNANVLKVDNFLNHQLDIELLEEVGKEFYRIFVNEAITKILTIEASGIAVACFTAKSFSVPAVFAKKSIRQSNIQEGNQTPINLDGDMYIAKVESFTHKRTYDIMVAKKFISPSDRVLLIDDFLANGSALEGLCSIVVQSGAYLAGAGIVIEKGFQPGGQIVRDKNVRVESLAIIESMSPEGGIVFK